MLEVDRASGQWRVFASGLRNPNGPSWNPQTGELWVVVNERDELGNDLVPDYMTSVKDGAFYGWPYSYYGDHVDTRVEPQRPDLVQKAMAPDYALGAHTASLGLAFNTGNLFPPEMEGGAFIGQHGSWNRKPRAGYKVIFVPFKDGKPVRPAAGRADRLPQRQGRGAGPPGRRAARQAGRAAGRRRRRQHDLARDAGGEIGGAVRRSDDSQTDDNAACIGRAVVIAELPSSSRAYRPSESSSRTQGRLAFFACEIGILGIGLELTETYSPVAIDMAAFGNDL